MDNIKKVIFDIDNTLIIWKQEYICALKETLDYFDIKIDVNLVDNVIDNLEQNHKIISKEILLNDINEKFNLNLEMSFINMLFEKQKELAFYNKKIFDTIKYLSRKYELLIFTNYFHEV